MLSTIFLKSREIVDGIQQQDRSIFGFRLCFEHQQYSESIYPFQHVQHVRIIDFGNGIPQCCGIL